MIDQQSVSEWQTMWTSLLNMTYYGRDIVSSIDTTNISVYRSWVNEENFEEVTFEHMWKEFSKLKDTDGKCVEPQVVHELKKLHVPLFLFQCLGCFVFMKHCFPDCEVTYWEDSTA